MIHAALLPCCRTRYSWSSAAEMLRSNGRGERTWHSSSLGDHLLLELRAGGNTAKPGYTRSTRLLRRRARRFKTILARSTHLQAKGGRGFRGVCQCPAEVRRRESKRTLAASVVVVFGRRLRLAMIDSSTWLVASARPKPAGEAMAWCKERGRGERKDYQDGSCRGRGLQSVNSAWFSPSSTGLVV